MESLSKASKAYLETAQGPVAERLRFLEGLWTLQYADSKRSAYEAPTKETAEESLVTGQPLFLLSPVSISFDAYMQMVGDIARYLATSGVLPEEQNTALESTNLDDVVKSHWEMVGSRPAEFISAAANDAATLGLNQVTSAFLLQSSLVPFLKDAAHAAIGAVDGIKWETWGSGDCPICGSPAAMGMMGESDQHKGASRVLWCSVCDAEWGYERLRCVRCGTRDASKLRYSHLEEDPAHRVHLCDECKGYIKMLFLADTDKPVSFPVEDAVSAEMDAVARSAGYSAEAQGDS